MKISIPKVKSFDSKPQENEPAVKSETSETKDNYNRQNISSLKLSEANGSKSNANLENSIHRFDRSSRLYGGERKDEQQLINMTTPKLVQPSTTVNIDVKNNQNSIFDQQKVKKTANKIILKK